MEIGGDWYDVIPLDDHRLLTVVGDVSGRGLRAATTMASLRYAIHAYAAQSDPPADDPDQALGTAAASPPPASSPPFCARCSTSARTR